MASMDALAAIAHAQNGLFRADQARTLGISRHWISRRTGSLLSVPLPKVYWMQTGPPPRDVLLDAALQYAGEGAALSYWTAAEVWRLRAPEHVELHVTTTGRRQVRSIPGRLVAHRSSELAAADLRVREGRLVTTVERTIVDLASCTPSRREVRAFVADAVQQGRTTPQRLSTEAAKRPTLPRMGVLKDVLVAVTDGARSVLEIELREHIARASLPVASHNLPVLGASGTAYRADVIWPAQRLIVEVDGREWHLSPDAWEHDLERTADLTAAGYTVLRFTAKAIRRRTAATVGVIASALESRVTNVAV